MHGFFRKKVLRILCMRISVKASAAETINLRTGSPLLCVLAGA